MLDSSVPSEALEMCLASTLTPTDDCVFKAKYSEEA
jgi:hypothetical protein